MSDTKHLKLFSMRVHWVKNISDNISTFPYIQRCSDCKYPFERYRKRMYNFYYTDFKTLQIVCSVSSCDKWPRQLPKIILILLYYGYCKDRTIFSEVNISPDDCKQEHSVRVQKFLFYHTSIYFNTFPNIHNEISLLPLKVNRQFTFQLQRNEKPSKYFGILMALGIRGYRPAMNRK